MDSQFQEILFESPSFLLMLPEEHRISFLYFHRELLVTVVRAHEKDVASIGQGARRDVRDYSIFCLRCVWLPR